ncbi:MAG: hypothetical protein R3E96_06420 [Planctomycetota bacterium]
MAKLRRLRAGWNPAVALCGLLLWGCHAAPVAQPLPAPSAAARAAYDSFRTDWHGGGTWQAAREQLQTAAQLDPTWAVPQRELDDLSLRLLQGPAAVRTHFERFGEYGGNEAYFLGRLMPAFGEVWFRAARKAQPQDPGGWHGLAFHASRDGREAIALEYEARALALAREPVERRQFASALARYQSEAGAIDEALETLENTWKQLPEGVDRWELQADWVHLAGRRTSNGRGARREFLARALCANHAAPLSLVLRILREPLLVDESWAVLLLERPETEARLAGAQLLKGTLTDWVEGALGQASQPSPWRVGDLEAGLGELRARMPEILLASDVYAQSPLHALELKVRAGGDALAVLPAMLAAGLYDQALEWMQSPAIAAEKRGEVLETWLPRILHAQAALARMETLLDELDRGRARVAEPGGESFPEIESLHELLTACAQILAEEGVIEPAQVDAVVQSPTLGVAGVADVVHPGPTFAAWEDRPGEPVPGLAAALRNLGRVGIFGSAIGVPPDGTVLPLIAAEPIGGEQLGVAYRGTRHWCRAADVGARAMRAGATVAGAALHEGYYLDLDQLWPVWQRWQRIEEGLADAALREAWLAALEDPGVPVETLAAAWRLGRDQGEGIWPDPWIASGPLLGQADRLRIALILERTAAGDPVDFGDIVAITAQHEEGHLCERTRFLPLHKHPARVLGFLAATGFSPQAIQSRLEYRAQLSALCVAEDPRIVLVDILEMGEGETGLPHGAAYDRLLGHLLEELKSRLADAAEAGEPPAWQPDRAFLMLHQLHRLPADELRAAALAVARREGLTGSGF